MKIRLKKLLSKYKNRIFSFIAVIACIPFFSISSFAADVSPNAKDNWYLLPFNTFNALTNRYEGEFNDVSGVYSSTVNDSAQYFSFTVGYDTGSVMPYFYKSHRYLVYFTCTAGTNVSFSSIDQSFEDKFQTSSNYLPLNILSSQSSLVNGSCTYSFIADMYLNYDFYLDTSSAIILNMGAVIPISGRFDWAVYSLDITDNTETEVNSIISAINNQTDVLGNYIDKGNGSTSGIVSGNNSAIDNLDDVVNQYRETEQTFFDDFNTNQQAITSDIVGWSWGGLVNCADWVGSTLTGYYNNMGDFRQYIIYPLMLGIALFFLGRGGSIIGHLFRKPTETTVNTKSVFRREGNTRYTTTTTSRQGGVWRK